MARGRGAFAYERGKHLIVSGILHTFADESGIENTAQYCIIAGYIGPPRQWQRFRREWRRVLRKYRVPEFHAKDFYQPERRKNVAHYAGWSEDRASDFLAALLTAINDRDIEPISTSVDVPAFNSFDHDERRYLTGGLLATHAEGYEDGSTVVLTEGFKSSGAPSRPYMAIFQRFVGEALIKAPANTKVYFTFDTQTTFQVRAIETFQEQFKGGFLSADREAKAAGIRYADSLYEDPLQAADLLAYFWNRVAHEAVRSRLLLQTRDALTLKPHAMSYFKRKHLQNILDSTLDDAKAQIKRVQKWLGR